MSGSSKTLKLLVGLTLLAVASLPGVALASSYTTTLDYTVNLRGITRPYDGNNLRITFTSSASFDHPTNKSQIIRLYRDNPWLQTT